MARTHAVPGGPLTDPDFEIPLERLPPGFAESINANDTTAAVPRPAATAVVMRDGEACVEVLLLQRHRSSGFVPGAHVFPGGRVDASDAVAPAVAEDGGTTLEPAVKYRVAAIREVFEETGVLLARDARGEWAPDCTTDPAMESWREQLMAGQASLADVLADRQLRACVEEVVYFSHWITPVAEPRRYDTRFFLARLPDHRTARADPREMIDAIWLGIDEAMQRFEAGQLPMVFPTVRTLQSLRGYDSVDAALAAARTTPVHPILPRLVRTPTGVGIVIDQDTT